MPSNEDGPGPQLGFWEKADIPFMYLSLCGSLVYAAITGVFRGKASPRRYDQYVKSAVIRKLLTRRSDRQMQYVVLSLQFFCNLQGRIRMDTTLTLYYRTDTSVPQLQRPTQAS